MLGDDRFISLWKKKIANGAAPAVSGFTGDHGLPLLEDPHCLRGLSLLIQLIRNGQLSEQCRTYLLNCPVIPTVKRTGGIRPITIRETLYKMAAAIALNDVENDSVHWDEISVHSALADQNQQLWQSKQHWKHGRPLPLILRMLSTLLTEAK